MRWPVSRNEKKIAGLYLRVSTAQQQTDSQAAELRQYAEKRGWECRIYSDVQSGAKENRPGLENLLADARRRR